MGGNDDSLTKSAQMKGWSNFAKGTKDIYVNDTKLHTNDNLS